MAKQTTNPGAPALSDNQELAIQALLTGQTIEAAAEVAGVARQTLSGWINHDMQFISALRSRRAQLWSAHIDRLRCLLFEALATIEDDLQADDPDARRQAAQFVVKTFAGQLSDLQPHEAINQERIALELWSN